MTTSRRILFISLPVIAFIVLGAVFYSSTSTAHPWQKLLSVSYEPDVATITLAPGEIKTIEVMAIIDCKHPELDVVVSPELEPYISVSPSEIHKCKKGDNDSEDDSDSGSDDSDSDEQKKDRGTNKVILNITAEIPTTVDLQTIDGTIWLESKKAASVKLPVVLNVWEMVKDDNIGVAFYIPPEWEIYSTNPTYIQLLADYSGEGIPQNPESGSGVCKLTVSSATNPSNLPLIEWVNTYGVGIGAPENITITPISTPSGDGFQVVGEELAKQTITWFDNTSDITAMSLVCDSNYAFQGESAYSLILNSMELRQ